MGARRTWLTVVVSVAAVACASPGPAGPSAATPATATAAPSATAEPSVAGPASVEPEPDPSTATTASERPSTSPPPTLQSAFYEVRSGVVRLEVALCEGSAIGSGFAVSPDLITTAAHVVDRGQVIRAVQDTTSTAAEVVGIDPGADVALLRTAVPLDGQSLSFAAQSPRVGDEVAAIGFPLGQPLSYNAGTVNGLGRKAVIEGIPRHDLVEIDAATTHGSSGGPVIRADGTVVGIVDAGPDGEPGRRLAVSSETARALIARWTATPEPVMPSGCAAVTREDGSPVSSGPVPARADVQSVATLDVYFRAINVGDFATAVAQLAEPTDLASFTEGVTSSQERDIRYRTVRTEGEALVVWATFTSYQDPGRGPAERPEETCTDWSLDYRMVPKNGLWLIDSTRPHDASGSAPCAAGSSSPNPSPND